MRGVATFVGVGAPSTVPDSEDGDLYIDIADPGNPKFYVLEV